MEIKTKGGNFSCKREVYDLFFCVFDFLNKNIIIVIMKREELIGKEFKWISTLTGGETFGVIEKIINNGYQARITSSKGNVYQLRECTVKIDGEFKEIKIED